MAMMVGVRYERCVHLQQRESAEITVKEPYRRGHGAL
jgi:hypothetical protein